MSQIAWSYSRLSQFANCPLQYNLVTNLKKFPFTETKETLWGKEVHKALELRVTDGQALPQSLAHMSSFMDKIASKPGAFAEIKMTINSEFQPVTWFAKDAWCRGQLDVGVDSGKDCWVGDYKTGKRRPDSDQLKLFAALTMHHKPKVDTVKTSFIWLKDNKMDSEVYTRDQLPEIWRHFLPKVARIEAAYDKDKWPAKPSGLCGWCPATKEYCDFAKK